MGNWGGRREGAGRPIGSVSKNTAELKELAREFGPSAIQRLALMAGLLPDQPGADSHAVQVTALKELLDRGYGRATLPLEGGDMPLVVDFRWADDPVVTQSSVTLPAPDDEGAGPVLVWDSSY